MPSIVVAVPQHGRVERRGERGIVIEVVCYNSTMREEERGKEKKWDSINVSDFYCPPPRSISRLLLLLWDTFSWLLSERRGQ